VVSYVINDGPRNVAPETRERVMAAITRLDYRPNAVARSLRSLSTTVLGLIVTDMTNAYCSQLSLAVENAAQSRGHTLLLGNSMHDDARQAKHIETFFSHQVRGIVFIGSTFGKEHFSAATSKVLTSSRTPLVFLDRSTSEFGGTTIVVDNRGGARMATEHLLGHGHTSVANFSGSPGHSAVQDRTRGWTEALTAAGLSVDRQPKYESGLDRYEAFAAARTILESPDRPTAIFSHSDEQSIGITYAAMQLGLHIPEDLALVSFDGIEESAILPPGLTTVEQPIAHAAELAVNVILDGPDGLPGLDAANPLPVRLAVRRSCGCS
jgi:LacI family transcriptional regulator